MKIYAIYDFTGTTTPDLSYIDGIVEQNGSIVHIVYNGIPDDAISEYRVFPENPDNLISGYEHMYSPLSGQPAEYQIISMDDKPVDIKYNIKLPLHGHSARSIVSGILSWARLPFSQEQLNQALQAASSGDHSTAGYAKETWVLERLPSQTEKNRWNTAHDNYPVSIAFVGDTNKKVVLTTKDGTTLETAVLDGIANPDFTDDVINTLDFNENNDGVLRAITSEGYAITTSIDGRYSQLGHTHAFSELTGISAGSNQLLLGDGSGKDVGDFADSINRFYKGNAPDGTIINTPTTIGDGFGAYSVSGSIEGYPHSGNARALIRVAGYDRRYVGELAFHTSTGNIWTRGTSHSGHGDWKEIFHEGNLKPSDYFKIDGTRPITGNLTVGENQSFPLINFGPESEGRRLVRSGDVLKWQGDGNNAKTLWHEGNFTPSGKADKSITISAGIGLTGGGSLGSNRTINFDTDWGDNRYKRRYHWKPGGINNEGWTTIAFVNGQSLMNSTKLYVQGTTGSVVVNAYFEILANHSDDFYIQSYSGNYTEASIRLVGDDEDYFIQIKTSHANPVTLDCFLYTENPGDTVTTYTNNPVVTGDSILEHAAKLNSFSVSASGGRRAQIYIQGSEVVTTDTNQTITGTKIFDKVVYAPQGFSELNGPSLRKLKENIRPFEKSGLELVNSLNTQEFDYKDKVLNDGTKIRGVKNAIGFIADDTRPEFLNEKKEAVSFYNTVAILAKAVQELSAEKESLKKELKEQRESFEKRLSNLEKLKG